MSALYSYKQQTGKYLTLSILIAVIAIVAVQHSNVKSRKKTSTSIFKKTGINVEKQKEKIGQK